MTAAIPVTLDDPFVTVQIGTATALDISCHLRKVTLTNDKATADVATFCTPGAEKPVRPKWTLELEVLQSFGPDASTNKGLWDTLHPLAGSVATVVVKPTSATASATNPSATFTTYVPYLDFLDAGIQESTVYTIDFSVLGQPAFATA